MNGQPRGSARERRRRLTSRLLDLFEGYDEEDNENGELFRTYVLESDFLVLGRYGAPIRRTRKTSTWFGGADPAGHMLDHACLTRRAQYTLTKGL